MTVAAFIGISGRSVIGGWDDRGMSSKEDLHLPDQMMDLLFDEHRGLPVPIMNIQPDGSHDFTVVNYEWIGAHLDERLCGICGNKLGYWMAFVGANATVMAVS